MTAVLNLLAQNVNILDTVPATGFAGQPWSQLSAGEGGPGTLKRIEDVTAVTTSFVSAANNYARILRFPSNAKVKSMEIYTDAAPDSSTSQALAFTVGVAFSDATQDGTPAAYQALVPTTANTGATTTFASHSSMNNIFGTETLAGSNAAIAITNLIFNGVGSTYPAISILQTPIVELFGFTTGQGYNIENLGYMDVYAFVTVAANTAHACNLVASMSFVDV
jgi:hypothetical protein